MSLVSFASAVIEKDATPLCPLFNECGGCQFQDISYARELALKEEYVRRLFLNEPLLQGLCKREGFFAPIAASPDEYRYRSRMDLKLLRTRDQRCFLGFSPVGRYRVVEANSCPIAMQPISDFLPELKSSASARLPAKYRNANLVIKAGDDGRVMWGGIGRRSLKLREEDYLWTGACGPRVYFSLDTFFQANLSILPALMAHIRSLRVLDATTVFLDLYGGVGLFGVCFASEVDRVVLIEENVHASRLARFNAAKNRLNNFIVIDGRMEDHPCALSALKGARRLAAMIDPPRNGLSPQAAEFLSAGTFINDIFYLSCNPEALIRDLRYFVKSGWALRQVKAFDFFPKTRHVETFLWLSAS